MAETGRSTFALRDASRPLLVLGPSLGTSVTALWHDAAEHLIQGFDVVGWDLPGHATAPPFDGDPSGGTVTMASLAESVLRLVDQVQEERGDVGTPFWYAGVSVGGAVGLQLLLDAPSRVAGGALICTGAKIGVEEMWRERATLVEGEGTGVLVEASTSRWFTPSFVAERPEVVERLLRALRATDRHAYAAVCGALAEHDVRERLAEIAAPVVAIAGGRDDSTPVAALAEIVSRAGDARLVVLDGVSHLAPAQAPAQVAATIRSLVAGELARTDAVRARQGMEVRREVLSADYVSRAVAGTTALTADFQDLITRYAWGDVWSRPGLERRIRSAVAITALISGGHWDELAIHLRAGLRNGLTLSEIREILLQTAVYCSVPSANHAFAVAKRVFEEEGME